MDEFDPLLAYTTIQGIVFKYSPVWIDRESLVHDLWIWCWENKCPPDTNIIRRRVGSRAEYEYRRLHPDVQPPKQEKKVDTQALQETLTDITNKAGLTKEEMEVIYLHYYLDMSNMEMAKHLGTTPSKVRSLLGRALNLLILTARKEY